MACCASPIDEKALTEARKTVLENLSPSPVSIDELVRHSDLSASVVLAVLVAAGLYPATQAATYETA